MNNRAILLTFICLWQSCALGMDNTTPLQRLLSTDFTDIRSSTVSYLYYPEIGGFGHSELEVDDECWDLTMACTANLGSLKQRISRVKNKQASPTFFRFLLTVSPAELHNLKKRMNPGREPGNWCSYEALAELSTVADINMPLLCKLVPSFSAVYLIAAKKWGNTRIKDIEFYSNAQVNRTVILAVEFSRDFIITAAIVMVGVLVVEVLWYNHC